jgi:hypothetical protein
VKEDGRLKHEYEEFCMRLVTPKPDGRMRSHSEAYIEVFGPIATAKQCAWNLLRRPEVSARLAELRNEIIREVLASRAPFAKAVETLAEGLDAYIAVKVKDGNGKTEFKRIPDFRTRNAASIAIIKLYEAFGGLQPGSLVAEEFEQSAPALGTGKTPVTAEGRACGAKVHGE